MTELSVVSEGKRSSTPRSFLPFTCGESGTGGAVFRAAYLFSAMSAGGIFFKRLLE